MQLNIGVALHCCRQLLASTGMRFDAEVTTFVRKRTWILEQWRTIIKQNTCPLMECSNIPGATLQLLQFLYTPVQLKPKHDFNFLVGILCLLNKHCTKASNPYISPHLHNGLFLIKIYSTSSSCSLQGSSQQPSCLSFSPSTSMFFPFEFQKTPRGVMTPRLK